MEVAGSMMNFCKSFSYMLFEVFFFIIIIFFNSDCLFFVL